MVKIQVCTPEIIRVIAAPGEAFSERPSLIVDKTEWPKVDWTLEEDGDTAIITTNALTVKVDQQTGVVAFYQKDGELILREKAQGSKIFTPATVMEEETTHIQQLFESPQDEAFYGLGQHQNGVMNYKGHDVDLWQYNIVAAVPFLASSRNYGILWDNNSRIKFGDIRDFQSLDQFKLFDKEGKPGGLTAEYFKDSDFSERYTSRQEPRIQHEYLDVNDEFPDGFRRNVRAIRWSGEIEATESGIHKFKLYCSSYTKFWLNGELVVDNWRQNWLPWTHLPKLEMEAGKRYSIKIEWIHGGGFIGLRALTPHNPVYDDHMSLYSEVADQIDYYFVHGDNMDKLIAGYREITGKAPMMPKWAMGLWQCRERYKTQEELLGVVREFREKEIPLDNIVQDWFYWEEDKWGDHKFDKARFPDPDGMIDELHDSLNTRIMISVWPKFYVGTEHFKAFNDKGWLYQRNIEKEERDWVGQGYFSSFYDPYTEGARKLFWEHIRDNLFSKGIDAWWLDATEPDIHSNLSRPETRLRLTPTGMGTFARYLNTFSLMNAKGIYNGQRDEAPNQRVFILTRSAYAGQQRYSAATWSGDIVSRWFDFKCQISAGMNIALSGIPYWTTDIGGFAVEQRYERQDPAHIEEWRELNTRWFQFGAFTPLFRVHGQLPFREMFNIAPDDHPAYKSMLVYDKLRYRLMPYIYSMTGMVTHDDYTIMRALIMDFQNDEKVYNIDDQFMFGPSLLVNPVTEFKARSREVYLPQGAGWYAFKSGTFLEGGQTLQAEAPYEDMPLYVKAGSIIPFGPEIQYTDEKPADPIRLAVYTGADANFELYEDENVNYNYENGAFATIAFTWDEAKKELTIEDREGEFPGMVKERTFEIVWIGKNKSVADVLQVKVDKSVTYNGKKVTVTM